MIGKSISQKIFFWTTVLLILFGVLGQILSEMMGYSLQLTNYLICMLLVIFAGYSVFWLTKFLRKKQEKILQWLIKTAGIILLIWTILMTVICSWYQIEEVGDIIYYGNGWYLSITEQTEEVKYLISKCHFIGKGDTYYNYPDEMALTSESSEYEQDEKVSAAVQERDKAEAVFGNFRMDLLLPVLSYQYGLWMNYLYVFIVLAWSIGAVGTFFNIQGRIKRLFYIICGIEVLFILGSVAAGSFGMIPFIVSHPFATDWLFNLVCLSPQLGIMFGVLEKETE